MTITNRIAVITGGNRGLGKSMALALADRGVDIILTYKSGAETAAAVVRQIEAKGRKAVALPLDVSLSASYPAFVDAVRRELEQRFKAPRIDFLVNNAGIGLHSPFIETTEDQFDELFRVHLKAAYFLTQRLVPLINDGGRILNVSTGLARFSLPGYSAYASMKGAVEVLTRYLAQELGPRKITVNVLAPGAIETDFSGGFVRDVPSINQMVASQTALGRVGLPDDIGPVVAALLSPDTAWINGQRIEVSGGQNL